MDTHTLGGCCQVGTIIKKRMGEIGRRKLRERGRGGVCRGHRESGHLLAFVSYDRAGKP